MKGDREAGSAIRLLCSFQGRKHIINYQLNMTNFQLKARVYENKKRERKQLIKEIIFIVLGVCLFWGLFYWLVLFDPFETLY